MQTFLPYQSFTRSLKCLDDRRLGKQRVEAMQILDALQPYSTSRWKNHPAVKMWRGYERALRCYHDTAIQQWINRGFNNNMRMLSVSSDWPISDNIGKPSWLTPEFCSAHRCNLLRKDFQHYSQFNWPEMELDFNNVSYIWPVN